MNRVTFFGRVSTSAFVIIALADVLSAVGDASYPGAVSTLRSQPQESVSRNDSTKLELLSSAEESPVEDQQPLLKKGGDVDKKALVKQKRLKIATVASATISVVAAVAAHYYMLSADTAYQKYLDAGHPDDMEHYFHRAEVYDRLAGYSLALFEVSFLLAMFTFFSSLQQ